MNIVTREDFVKIADAIPETAEELFTAINSLFQYKGEYDRAYILDETAPDGRVIFETYANGYLKPEGEAWIPEDPARAIRIMWQQALTAFQGGKRDVWWRHRPEICTDNENPGRKYLYIRLKFT